MAGPFALMLLDVMMPDMDGFEVANAVAHIPNGPSRRILILSSPGLAGEADRCRALGVSARLTKPVASADLLNAIDRALHMQAKPAAVARQLVTPIGTAAQRLRILVAEDNAVNQRVARGLLSKRGHEVIMVGNGREALEALAGEHRFDLVLMDVQMPEMDGLEATAAIRARERTLGGHVRIVAMTAHALAEDAGRCLHAGMDGYLSKPLDVKVLWTIVEAPIETPATIVPCVA